MQITAELDKQHIDKLHNLEINLKKSTCELIAFAIDEVYSNKSKPTEGEKLLGILKQTGYLGSLSDDENLSETYKEHLDWSHKV